MTCLLTFHSPGVTELLKEAGRKAPEYAKGSNITRGSTQQLDLAMRLAANAAVSIVCVGIDSSIEHEGSDRRTIGLPPVQLKLLQSVAEASKGKVIVVLVNGGPVSVDWLKHATKHKKVQAILEGFDGGQSGGQAVAEVIFGKHNPSGSLPYTLFPENYVNQIKMSDMAMRPSGTTPGRTYRQPCLLPHTPDFI